MDAQNQQTREYLSVFGLDVLEDAVGEDKCETAAVCFISLLPSQIPLMFSLVRLWRHENVMMRNGRLGNLWAYVC